MQGNFKRLIKLAISIGFFGGRTVANVLRRIVGSRVRGEAVILYYHGIRPEQQVRFGAQMDLLARLSKPVEADFRAPLPDGGRFAAVTFDDGFVSFLESALPELERRRIPATLFVIADRLGCYPDWPAYVPDPSFSEPIMTKDQLLKLPPDLITIGSHTLTHPTLTLIDEKAARRELLESRVLLEKTLGRKISLFSFPHGAYDEKMVDWCRESGYERVYTIVPVPAFSTPSEYTVGRVWTDPDDWALEFRLKLLGAYCWLPLAFGLKRKILSIAGLSTPSELAQNVG